MKTLTLTTILATNVIIGLGQNLISNWSFENGNMQLNCQDWYDGCGNELTISCDTIPYCQVGFYNQSPSDIPEEVWSLQLDAGFLSDGIAETYITGQSGTKVYRLEYWMKSEYFLFIGFASIGTVSQNQFTAHKTISDTASEWKQIAFTDTLTTHATDTIAVRLSAGNCDYCVNRVYFDFIDLTVIDSLTLIEDIGRFDNDDIKIYPIPSTKSITFEFNDNKNEYHTLTVYNSTGQLIKTIQNNESIMTFDNRDMGSGLYYYQVQNMTDQKIMGRGKFIKE